MKNYNFDDINWEETGLLYGQLGVHRETLIEFLNKIDFKDETIQKETLQFLAPCIRKIILNICDVLSIVDKKDIDNKLFYLKDIDDDILNKVDIKLITEMLDEFVVVYLPISKKYLSLLDYEAELINLFCENYIRSIM